MSLCTYECRLVPGLLQSRHYARAVFEGTVPVTPDDELDHFMDRRMERQRMLVERPTTPFSFIVEEHVFRRRFGDDARMRGLFDQRIRGRCWSDSEGNQTYEHDGTGVVQVQLQRQSG